MKLKNIFLIAVIGVGAYVGFVVASTQSRLPSNWKTMPLSFWERWKYRLALLKATDGSKYE